MIVDTTHSAIALVYHLVSSLVCSALGIKPVSCLLMVSVCSTRVNSHGLISRKPWFSHSAQHVRWQSAPAMIKVRNGVLRLSEKRNKGCKVRIALESTAIRFATVSVLRTQRQQTHRLCLQVDEKRQQ